MGIFDSISSLFGLYKKQVNILTVGLDNSGKSTILNHMKPSEYQNAEIVPTVGFNLTKFKTSTMNFTAFDTSGQERHRSLWETHYKNCEAIIFVVDSCDRLRMVVAKDELWLLLDHRELATRQIPLLVFANKMDGIGALTASEVSTELSLDLIRNHCWHIYASCAITGQGLEDGFNWLAKNVRGNHAHGR